MRPVPRIPAYAFRANASGRLINKPTIAPANAGCTRSETFAANKPMAKRLEKACKSIPVVRSGWFPKTIISTSITPNAMPHSIPRTIRFMAKLVHYNARRRKMGSSIGHSGGREKWARRPAFGDCLQSEHQFSPGGGASNKVIRFGAPIHVRKPQQRAGFFLWQEIE